MVNSALSVLVIGTGKRVLETALPAFATQPDRFVIRHLFARRAKTVTAAGTEHSVAAFDDLEPEHLDGIDLIYLAVTKDAVPSVLERLSNLAVNSIDLLIDTPVVRFKHFRHTARLKAFRHTWVAEDIAYLPWLETVQAALASGAYGSLRTLVMNQSAYAYHGVALAKALASCRTVRSGRRVANTSRAGLRSMIMGNGVRVQIIEPRNYQVGTLLFAGSKGTLADFAFADDSAILKSTIENGRMTGFTCGDHATSLSPEESELTVGEVQDRSVTAQMNSCKRVGFARLLKAIHAGHGAYPLDDAMDDMVVDYHLEKFARYRANPLTSYRSPLARTLLRTGTRLGG